MDLIVLSFEFIVVWPLSKFLILDALLGVDWEPDFTPYLFRNLVLTEPVRLEHLWPLIMTLTGPTFELKSTRSDGIEGSKNWKANIIHNELKDQIFCIKCILVLMPFLTTLGWASSHKFSNPPPLDMDLEFQIPHLASQVIPLNFATNEVLPKGFPHVSHALHLSTLNSTPSISPSIRWPSPKSNPLSS